MRCACSAESTKVEEVHPVGNESRMHQFGVGIKGQHRPCLLGLASLGYKIKVCPFGCHVGKQPVLVFGSGTLSQTKSEESEVKDEETSAADDGTMRSTHSGMLTVISPENFSFE